MEKRIAVISDIHGNLPALIAVLEDIQHFPADIIYCLGDLTDAAPWHNEVISTIRSLAIPTIMGNHDERIAFDHPVHPLSKHGPEEQVARLAAINYTKATITADNKMFLSHLPHHIRFEAGGKHFLLVHGSADSNDEYLYDTHNAATLQQMLSQQQADIMVCGHTHISYLRTLPDGKQVINTGSVGRTKEQDGKATYLQIVIHEDTSIQYTLRKVTYNIKETADGIRSSEIPDFYADLLEKII
ncbi:metallophosphoesterase family protein [Chitinophaga solisilvae]|uniref:metallophosphoesterase family protein n=1 Tax=Chitinophaga solisilvae TaxID=1233460 RepID=UPI0013691731|nr:metallophosphoesterase family protein [Chitinophaga solisilvae]